MQITDIQLLDYSSRGLIPGPEENEADFLKRVDFCLKLNEVELKILEKEFGFAAEEAAPSIALEDVFPSTQRLFGIKIDWIPLFFSNRKLAPWHGGCAWIFQLDEKTPTAALMQLRSHFRNHLRYLGLYQRNELITHELAHVGRMMFEEPQFEELIAYRTSTSRFRSWFGPILQSSREVLLFVGTVAIIFGLDLLAIFTDQSTLYHQLKWAKLIPFLLLFAGVGRLWRRQSQFKRCLEQLEQLLKDSARANEVAYRLTDAEIRLFAQSSQADISKYVDHHKSSSLRGRLLELYFRGV